MYPTHSCFLQQAVFNCCKWYLYKTKYTNYMNNQDPAQTQHLHKGYYLGSKQQRPRSDWQINRLIWAFLLCTVKDTRCSPVTVKQIQWYFMIKLGIISYCKNICCRYTGHLYKSANCVKAPVWNIPDYFLYELLLYKSTTFMNETSASNFINLCKTAVCLYLYKIWLLITVC